MREIHAMNADSDCLAPREIPAVIDGLDLDRPPSPTSLALLSELLRTCHAEGTAVYPVGGGVATGFGLPPARSGLLLDTSRLDCVEDYPSEDMTITVGAGIRLAELADILASKNQCLPIDAGDPRRATLGGLLATGHSGPRRFGYGTPRDYVIGIDCVHADGNQVHGGGRVVKNVAGYDFMKMHTGAFGTLGIIARVTLKLKPLPAARRALLCDVGPGNAEDLLATMNRSMLRPVAVELLNASARAILGDLDVGGEKPWLLVLLFEESPPAVDWQLEEGSRILRELGLREIRSIDADRYSDLLERLASWTEQPESSLVFKANVLPSRVVDFMAGIELLFPETRAGAHAGNGIVWGSIGIREWEEVQLPLASLRRMASADGGNLVLPRCPTAWKQRLAVWGDPPSAWHLMKRLKRKLDPRDILNPGRLFPSEVRD